MFKGLDGGVLEEGDEGLPIGMTIGSSILLGGGLSGIRAII